MNNLKKISAFIMVCVLVMSLAACSSVPKTLNEQYSYKTNTKEYSAGEYVFALFAAYQNAYGIVSQAQGDKFDSSKSIMDVESTFDETGKVWRTSDWIRKEADIIMRNLIGMDQTLEKYGIELDEQIVNNARDTAKANWYLGEYYNEYPEYATPVRNILEPFGVSFESYFNSSYELAQVKESALFNYLYNKGGAEEVASGEVEDYFYTNYSKYSYFTMNLYTSTVDEAGSVINTPFSSSETKAAKEILDSYQRAFDSGVSFEGIVDIFKQSTNQPENPMKTMVENLKGEPRVNEEVSDAVRGMKENTMKVIYVGSDESPMAYAIYKYPLAQQTELNIKDDVVYSQVLWDIKGDEFSDYLNTLADEAVYEVNEKFVDKCDPKMFEED